MDLVRKSACPASRRMFLVSVINVEQEIRTSFAWNPACNGGANAGEKKGSSRDTAWLLVSCCGHSLRRASFPAYLIHSAEPAALDDRSAPIAISRLLPGRRYFFRRASWIGLDPLRCSPARDTSHWPARGSKTRRRISVPTTGRSGHVPRRSVHRLRLCDVGRARRQHLSSPSLIPKSNGRRSTGSV